MMTMSHYHFNHEQESILKTQRDNFNNNFTGTVGNHQAIAVLTKNKIMTHEENVITALLIILALNVLCLSANKLDSISNKKTGSKKSTGLYKKI